MSLEGAAFDAGSQYPARGQMTSPPGHTAPEGHATQFEPDPHAQENDGSPHKPNTGSVKPEDPPKGHGCALWVAEGDACAEPDAAAEALAEELTRRDAVPPGCDAVGDRDWTSEGDAVAHRLGDSVGDGDRTDTPDRRDVSDTQALALAELDADELALLDGQPLGDGVRDERRLAERSSEAVAQRDGNGDADAERVALEYSELDSDALGVADGQPDDDCVGDAQEVPVGCCVADEFADCDALTESDGEADSRDDSDTRADADSVADGRGETDLPADDD